MYSIYYSDGEHDHFFSDTPSLFEATCQFYDFLNGDWNEGEWITIRDDDDNILKESH